MPDDEIYDTDDDMGPTWLALQNDRRRDCPRGWTVDNDGWFCRRALGDEAQSLTLDASQGFVVRTGGGRVYTREAFQARAVDLGWHVPGDETPRWRLWLLPITDAAAKACLAVCWWLAIGELNR